MESIELLFQQKNKNKNLENQLNEELEDLNAYYKKQKENIDYMLNILNTYKTKSLLNQLLYPEVQKIREEIERIFNVHINPLFHIIEAHKNKITQETFANTLENWTNKPFNVQSLIKIKKYKTMLVK